MTRLHATIAVLLGIVLPAYSWVDGSGWLAWTMFATSGTYRMHVRVTDRNGVTHVVNPTELARLSQGDAATYLSGADHFRHAPVGGSLRRNLPGLAALSCFAVPDAQRSWISLETRTTLDAPVVVSDAHAQCGRNAE